MAREGRGIRVPFFSGISGRLIHSGARSRIGIGFEPTGWPGRNLFLWTGSGTSRVGDAKPPKPVEKPRLRGEPLRDGRSPSVAALMERRIESMRAEAGGRAPLKGDSATMAKRLATWRDPTSVAAAPE